MARALRRPIVTIIAGTEARVNQKNRGYLGMVVLGSQAGLGTNGLGLPSPAREDESLLGRMIYVDVYDTCVRRLLNTHHFICLKSE